MEKPVRESVQPKKQDKPVSEEPKPTETTVRRGRPKKEQ